MKYSLLAGLFVATTTFPAVARKKAIELEALNASSYAQVVATSDSTPQFALQMEKYSILDENLLVAFLKGRRAMAYGEEQRVTFAIEDPASEISRQLASLVGGQLNVPTSYVDSGLPVLDKAINFKVRTAPQISEKFGAGRLVVNAATQMWSFGVFAKKKFRAMYMGSASVVDTNTGLVIGYAECVAPMKRKDDARDAESILADDAAELKAEIQDVVDFCVGDLGAKLLRM